VAVLKKSAAGEQKAIGRIARVSLRVADRIERNEPEGTKNPGGE
jgi:hypothetical protein